MLGIGAHMSGSGGVSKAVDRALGNGCEALQIFTRNASQWRGKPLDPAEVKAFLTRIAQTGIKLHATSRTGERAAFATPSCAARG